MFFSLDVVMVLVISFVLVVLFSKRMCVMGDFWFLIIGLGEDGFEGLFVVSCVVLEGVEIVFGVLCYLVLLGILGWVWLVLFFIVLLLELWGW